MARRNDIRRIGTILRRHGADGSLVAWVEAELERIDFAHPVPGCLSTLVEDLTAHERQLIVTALLTIALEGAVVDGDGIDAAIRLGRELGFDVVGVERVLREISGWSMQQARELASRKLPASTSPATLAEARRTSLATRRPQPPADADTLGPEDTADDPMGPTALDELGFDLPEVTDAANDLTEPGVLPEHPDPTGHTERMDHLAAVVRGMLDENEPPPEGSEDDDDAFDDSLDDDPPTVEMTPDAVRALLRRKRAVPEAAPPQFSPLGDALAVTIAEHQDGPPSLGLEASHNESLASAFDTLRDDELPATRPEAPPLDIALMPLDWGESDAFTVNDFTISERLADERFDATDPSQEEPTLFVRVPPEVQELIDAEAGAATEEPEDVSEPEPAPLVPMPLETPQAVLAEPPNAPAERTEGSTAEGPVARPPSHDDLQLSPPERAPAPAPSLDDVELRNDFLAPPPGDGWQHDDTADTAELLELDDPDELELDEAADGAFQRALSATAPLPTGEDLRAAPMEQELSLEPDDEELSLDPDTGDRLAVAGRKAIPWAPPEAPSPPSNLPDGSDDALSGELQPLEEGLAAYWAPQPLHLSDGLTGELRPISDGYASDGLTGELKALHPGDVQEGLTGDLTVLDPGDMQSGLTGDLTQLAQGDVQGGLTGELRAIQPDDVPDGLTGELKPIPPGEVERGLTGELRAIHPGDVQDLDEEVALQPEPRRRRRRRRRDSTGLTQDLTLLVDGDPRKRSED